LEKELEKIIKKEKKMAKIEIEEISKEPGIIELISGKQEEK
jgi:hypothetical protein